MRIATRLVLVLAVAANAVVAVSGIVSLRQREALLREAWLRETRTFAGAVQVLAGRDLEDGSLQELGPVLAELTRDPDTWAAALLDPDGALLAGGPADHLPCIRAAAAGADRQGWARCPGEVAWSVLPVEDDAGAVVVARSATLVAAEVAASRRRILLSLLLLSLVTGGAIYLVLNRILSRPLAEIMRGVRALGGPTVPPPVALPRSASELRELAAAFNEMTERLEGKRRTLAREVEERIALERRLRHAEKFAALGRLTGGLAHEVGTPLAAIAMRAEAIDDLPDASPDARRHAAAIVAQTDRIAELIRSLRHVARPRPDATASVDLAALVRQVAAALEDTAAAAGVVVTLAAPEPTPVRGDGQQLRHALYQVVLNAIQAAAGAVRIGADAEGEGAALWVEDDGPGIDPGARARVLEPFFTTRDPGEGTGLGLAICLGIVEGHGGRVSLEEGPLGGARVVLHLPGGGTA